MIAKRARLLRAANRAALRWSASVQAEMLAREAYAKAHRAVLDFDECAEVDKTNRAAQDAHADAVLVRWKE